MSDLSENGYFYAATLSTVRAAADAVSASWLGGIADGAYKDTTQRWGDVSVSPDGATYYTEKNPDDACNVSARSVEGILEGAGYINWLPQD